MSVISSAKTNFSTSEMSLAASLMTAASTFTFSDGDYETSSELPSPRILNNDNNSQISRCPSSPRIYSNYNYVIASQSSSMLLNKDKESTMSVDGNRYMQAIRSDTCLSQQNKAIHDFMSDIFKEAKRQQQPGEPNFSLTKEDSQDSIQSEFFPAVNTIDSLPANEINLNLYSSLLLTNDSITTITSENKKDQKLGSPCTNEEKMNDEENTVVASLSETKHKIMENLAQVTRNKFFFKPESSHYPSVDKGQGESLSKFSTPSQRSSLSRRSLSRSSLCMESILRIDYELQPLNLMLSKLLAEFRAMDLSGKLNYLNPSICSLSRYVETDKNLFSPEINNSKPGSRCSMRNNNVIRNEMTMMHEEPQQRMTFEEQKNTYSEFMQFNEIRKAVSLSHEHLDEHRAKSCAQTSRSWENNFHVSRDSSKERSHEISSNSSQRYLRNIKPRLADCSHNYAALTRTFLLTQRVKTSEKGDLHLRCCKRHRRKQSSLRESRCTSRQKDSEDDQDFVRKIMDEITSMSARCIDEKCCWHPTNDDGEKNENDSSQKPQNEENKEELGGLFRRGLISLVEKCTFFGQPLIEVITPDVGGGGDSVLNNNIDKDEVMLMSEEVCDVPDDSRQEESLLLANNEG